jgi:hypothetical protein
MSNILIGQMEIKNKLREENALLEKEFLERGGKIYKADIGEKADYKPESPQAADKEGKENSIAKAEQPKKTLADILAKHVGK